MNFLGAKYCRLFSDWSGRARRAHLHALCRANGRSLRLFTMGIMSPFRIETRLTTLREPAKGQGMNGICYRRGRLLSCVFKTWMGVAMVPNFCHVATRKQTRYCQLIEYVVRCFCTTCTIPRPTRSFRSPRTHGLLVPWQVVLCVLFGCSSSKNEFQPEFELRTSNPRCRMANNFTKSHRL